jgi:hypothetical protein
VTGVCAQLGDGDAAGRLSERLAPWAGHHLAATAGRLGMELPGWGRPALGPRS